MHIMGLSPTFFWLVQGMKEKIKNERNKFSAFQNRSYLKDRALFITKILYIPVIKIKKLLCKFKSDQKFGGCC